MWYWKWKFVSSLTSWCNCCVMSTNTYRPDICLFWVYFTLIYGKMSTEHNDCFSWKLCTSSTQEAASISHRNGPAMLAFDCRSIFSKFLKELYDLALFLPGWSVRYCLLFKAYVLGNYRHSWWFPERIQQIN